MFLLYMTKRNYSPCYPQAFKQQRPTVEWNFDGLKIKKVKIAPLIRFFVVIIENKIDTNI
ncbi:MAG: hypothetical protein CNE91_00320 [SAR116 cluster bacterium MED-G04]|nr:hypothetical protein [SAR116 cluster bacterium]OUW37033.1 MAG: hypothetical protein CBD43_02810 [Gammaproteobacteria bacterium TMED183]PDH66727.1 MAG: hypothetical protein CNE91_00320 [SAR116 cluster bacterium MED-G04]HCD49424.1 hypothetical protein [Alphaproteobacteria bacterium]HCV63588.1 hypothetical protein [Alphaproteobacteria bacterium]